MNVSEKRKAIMQHLAKWYDKLDPTGKNREHLHRRLSAMTDGQFTEYMDNLRSAKEQIHLVRPNMTKGLTIKQLMDIMEELGVVLYHRIWVTDDATGIKYLTNKKYPVVQMSVRRAQQFLDEKISIPESDTLISGMDDQVVGADRAAGISNPELHSLHASGLDITSLELLRVRGGDQTAYSDLKRQIEETGVGELGSLGHHTRAKSPIILSMFLRAMHIDSNM